MSKQDEMAFVKELWKIILEIEDLVSEFYQRLAEEEINDILKEDPVIPF